MKAGIPILMFFLLVSCAAAYAVSPHNDWKNALTPTGYQGSLLTLAKNGNALYSIIIPAKATGPEIKAAEDLSQWLSQIAGAQFKTYRDSDLKAPQKKIISVGQTKALASSGLTVLKTDLDREGYAIDEKNGNLFLIGGYTRGIINAVYALLEEDLGCRWYDRNTSPTIPSENILRFKPVKRSYVPDLEIRDPYYYEAFDETWSLRNRTNSSNASVRPEWGGNMAYALFVHTFNTLVPPDKYFKDHPEYFSEINGQRTPGQLCVSNPDVLKITIDRVKEILKSNPNAGIISVSQNDGTPCCNCAKCKATADAEGSLAGPLLNFVNAVADEVGKEYPHVIISTLAYLDTFGAPKTVRPRPNVAIQLCTDSHAWSEPFLTIEETQKFQNAMKSWSAMGSRIHIWDYTCNYSHYAAPMPNWQVVADSIRFFNKYHAKGVMLQGNYQTFGTSDGAMRCWVWAKYLWNPNLDMTDLMKDFVYGYYGKAAQPVWEYEQLLLNMWEKEHNGKLKSPAGGIRYGMGIFDKDFMDKAKFYFRKAESLADDPETLQRVEDAELQVLYAQLDQEYNLVQKQGKASNPDEFKAAVAKFEKIATRLKMTHMQEGAPDYEPWIAKMKKAAGI